MASSATEKYYEYIVVGCGGIGSATLYWLSTRKGVDVLGLEQFKLGHDNGGSQDYSRIIRMMYHDTKYTKLVKEAYKCWEEVEAESGLQILYKTGGVQFAVKGTPGESGLEKYAAAAKAEHIAFERVSGQQITARFPGFAMGSDVVGLYEPTAGLVDAAVGNATHIQLAQAHGATVIDSCPVLRIDTLPSGEAKVFTTRGQFRCRRVIITAGAWINNVLGTVGIHIPVSVTQEQVTYFATPNMKLYTKSQFPIFIYIGEKDVYGIPIHGNTGMKVGLDADGPTVSAETRSFTPDAKREQTCLDFVRRFMPKAEGPMLYSKTCLYTMTRDRHFVVDTLAREGRHQIVVCCGAGHAYKFASILGKILSELAIDGSTNYDISGFGLRRRAITDPTFKAQHHMASKGQTSKL